MKDIGKLIKDARLARGLSMREAAAECGVPLSTISKLESGKLDNPTFITLIKIGEALDIPPLEWFDNPPKRRKRK